MTAPILSMRSWIPSLTRIYDLDLGWNRTITKSDLNNNAPVVVIGSDIRDNLLAGVDPIGKEIRVDGHIYNVIGVGTKRGTTLGQSADNWVMMPITTWFKAYGTHNSLNIWAKTNGVGLPMEQAIDQARVILRSQLARSHRRQGQLRHRNWLDSFMALWWSKPPAGNCS